MNKKMIVVLLSVFVVSTSLFADAVVTMVLGKVQVKNDSGSWIPAKIKSAIKSSDTIRVTEGSKIVIKLSSGTLVSLNTPKEVRLYDLESQQAANSKKSINQLMREKGSKITTKSRQGTVTAVAGVRGADVDNQNTDKADAEQMVWKE